MAPQTARGRPVKPSRPLKRKRDDLDVETLSAAVSALDPSTAHPTFASLPLSPPTRAGLKAAHFTTTTDIQSRTLPLALQGKDILGAAKTGSGKTLAFLVPVLENLYRAQCVGGDAGLGAMVISPTRELAIQIFEVLRTIGRKGHLFAAGLVIGGKSLREERDALARMNIVVCTPGRILQHLSQTAAFSVDNLRMLVLDEADRILDMGFSRDLDAIIEYLPKERQTLLFSATQTKKVGDLARLSLREPEYISVHEAAASATPSTLQQNYVLTPLPEKLDTLWSFLTSTRKAKILVFLSSGKQVRFVYTAFAAMQPGIPLLHLHGRQKQATRLEITDRFRKAKHSCLFATDVVARGLDFPAVDWVVQIDCPEDAETYIHRVGRTARYERVGHAVLFLDPSEEEGMLRRLEHKKVPIERINVRNKKLGSIKKQVQSLCFQDPGLKYLGQKAFASYTRSLHVQKDKEVFDLQKYDLEGFAASLGLPGAPRIKFLKADAEEVKKRKNAPRMGREVVESDDGAEGSGGEDGDEVVKERGGNGVRTKYDRMFARRNQDVLGEHYGKMVRSDDDDEEGSEAQDEEVDGGKLDGEQVADEELFHVKRRIPADSASLSDSEDDDATAPAPNGTSKTINLPGASAPLVIDSKRREKLLKSKKKLLKFQDKGSRLVFDDEGAAHPVYELQDDDAFKAAGAAEEQRRRFVEEEAGRVEEVDKEDKVTAKAKRREKREKRKRREREDDGDEGGVMGGGEDAMANFLADAQAAEKDGPSDGEVEPERKKAKWFQRDVAVRRDEDDGEIGTFEDLEAEAAKLLG